MGVEQKTWQLTHTAASDKQKILLSTDAGHFSLIRALHLADLITEMNGKRPRPPTRLSIDTLEAA